MIYYNHKLSAAELVAAANPDLRDHWCYGGGRRICPSMHVAERSLFLNIARLMWGFDVYHAKDENGVEISVDATFGGMVPGATAVPRPFKCGEFALCCFFVDFIADTVLRYSCPEPPA
jgi:hypothetical protein